MKEKIVFFGSSKFVIPILEVLRKNFDLKLVLTTENLPTDPVPSYCIRSRVCYYVVTDFRKEKKILRLLKKTRATLGVLASFGALVPKGILNAFPKGIINIHPSLLPKFRGPTPVQTAILEGVKVTGVSIIKLDEEIDHGLILRQEKEKILDTDTANTLHTRLFEKGAHLLLAILNKCLKNDLKPTPQNHEEATFTSHLTRESGFVDIKNPPSVEKLQRMIRAYFPWPGTWTKLQIANRELRIKFLPNKKLQAEGKKPVSYKDFLNGYPEFDKQIFFELGLLDNHN